MIPRIESSPERRPANVAVVIPAYRRADLLREALRSVAEQRGVGFAEVIVTDDLGSAETAEVVRQCGIVGLRYERNPQRLGAVANWNRAVGLARADWVTVLHEDDFFYPWFLRSVTDRLRPGVAAVAVKCAKGQTAPELFEPQPPYRSREYFPEYFLKSAMTPFPGVVMSRALLESAGLFDPRWSALADYEFWYRLAKAGPIEVVQVTGAFYRETDGQWTAEAWPEMLRRTLLLRRKIAREQFARFPKLGRWFARFFTARNAREYFRRFEGQPDLRARWERIGKIPFAWMPSGWAWAFLRLLTGARRGLTVGWTRERPTDQSVSRKEATFHA